MLDTCWSTCCFHVVYAATGGNIHLSLLFKLNLQMDDRLQNADEQWK